MLESEKDESKVAGGLARARALTPERKRQIAAKAAAARWGNKLPRATHKGNFREDFGFDVDCYVLDDAQKTAVISQRGMGAAIGLTGSGAAFHRFASGRRIAPHVGAELRQKLDEPLVFQWGTAGAEQTATTVHGYDVTILVDFCKAILDADTAGNLLPRQRQLAQQARIILTASAKAGIKGLVYALAGYDATREEIITAFKLFVREEAREYEKEFPDQLYAEWYRIYELPKMERNLKPWKFKQLTVDQIYYPLANSSGKVYQLTQAQRERSKKRHQKLHQFLSEIGVKALRQQLGQLLGIARISRTKVEYEGYFQRLFGSQPGLFDLENPNG